MLSYIPLKIVEEEERILRHVLLEFVALTTVLIEFSITLLD